TPHSWAQTPLVDPTPSTLRSAARPFQLTQPIVNPNVNRPTPPFRRSGNSPLNPETYSIPQGATSSPFPQPAPSPIPLDSPFGPLNSPLNPASYAVPQGATSVSAPLASPSTLSESRAQEMEATRFSSGLYGDPAPDAPSPFPQTSAPLPPFFPASADDATPSAARARLETLAWALGCWELETNGFVFQTKIDWAPGGSYLLCRDFVRPASAPEVSAAASNPESNSVFSALRVIAWNPVAGLFQSTIFCRDGSYGSGLWQREGESWRVATRILLVDGRAATSVEYFTPRREGGFTWESTSRTVENTPLPNVGPAQARSLSAEEFELVEKSTFKSPDAAESPATKSEFE
ncbi:MAG: hypothetical protein IJ387_06150, partial [Thermoguttaceae bacterium]|nr:hypothetical protein [Thermoguttaceae bacterium]